MMRITILILCIGAVFGDFIKFDASSDNVRQIPPELKKKLDAIQPFYDAVESANLEEVQKFLTDGSVTVGSDQKGLALHMAAANGNEELVNLLLNSGANVNYEDLSHLLPLYKAAKYGNEKVAELLIKDGNDVNHKGTFNEMALHIAAENGHDAVVDLLLKNGADVNAANGYMFTPLHKAASSGSEKTVELLLNAGANVNAVSQFKETPIFHAVKFENAYEKVVQQLIKHGADVNHKNYEGKTPLDVANQNGFTKAVEVLRQNAA